MPQVLGAQMEELRAAMGQEWYVRFEDELNRVWRMENWAHSLRDSSCAGTCWRP